MRALLRDRTVRRFLRFAIVGASSTGIDTGLFWVLVQGLHWRPWGLVIPANIVSFTIGVTNGFVWNRYWTFRGAATGHAPTQYVRFVLVNLIGLAIDSLIVQAAFALGARFVPPDWLPLVAKLVALPPVALWNFTAHSFWTFTGAGSTFDRRSG